jgi:RraA family protein
MPIGFRIKESFVRTEKSVIEEFRGLAASTTSDTLGRYGAMNPRIKPLKRPAPQLLGPAFTVRAHAGDNLMAHKAIDMAAPGDVLVVEVSGDEACAIMGEIMCRIAQKRGIAGLVIDGLIRDSDELAEMDFPVYCVGASPLGPWKDGPGEIGFPVVCGGVMVNPGDVINADGDGVAVIPREDALKVAHATRVAVEKEKKSFAEIAAGTIDRAWVDKALKEKGCEFVK